eukprot:scaffold7626_cov55-Phaeocystis_antarctica.AAC.1
MEEDDVPVSADLVRFRVRVPPLRGRGQGGGVRAGCVETGGAVSACVGGGLAAYTRQCGGREGRSSPERRGVSLV